MRALVLAGLLVAIPAAVHAQEGEGDFGEEPRYDEDTGGRLRITAWGGNAWDTAGSGRGVPIFGGEASWAFGHLDVGFAGYGYQDVGGAGEGWSKVLLARFTQRFETYRGLDAGLTLGIGSARRPNGAGRQQSWEAWFQFGLGMRLDLGPMFLAGELAFEQNDLIHLTGGLGVKLF